MYRVELLLEDQKYGVITCEYVLSQKTDDSGKPIGKVRSGLIQVVLLSDEDEFFANWAADSNKQLDGKLNFYSIDKDGGLFKEVKFEGAYCIAYREYFLAVDFGAINISPTSITTSFYTEIAISAAKLTLDGTVHDNGWPG